MRDLTNIPFVKGSPTRIAPLTSVVASVTAQPFESSTDMQKKSAGTGKAAYSGTTVRDIAAKYKFQPFNTNAPTVSVIVPTYNVEQYLVQALDSLVKQTLKNIEIIVVNDGSKDNSLNIIRFYEKRDKRIIVIDKPNAGYGHSMNVGVARATGRYIAILEPDDYVELNMFEELCAVADKNNLDIVKSDFYRFQGEGATLKRQLFPCCSHKENYSVLIDPAKHLEIFRYVMNTWCGLYKREFLAKFGIWHNETPGASFQDNGFYFQTMTQAERLIFVNKAYYMNRRDNPNSSVKDKGKVYAANVEYSYISDIMDNKPVINEKFSSVFYLRKYHTYTFTIRRIDPSMRLEYIRNISAELAGDKKQGRLDKTLFTSSEWNGINWIIRDPDEYYNDFVRNSIAVSVIIPVYNVAPYLRECLDSVVKQTLKNIEVILIDDGSTDGSTKIIKEYADRDERVKAIYQQNLGAGVARNKGLEVAMGKYLSFLDADDFFELGMLEKAYYKAIRDDNAEICAFKCADYDELTKARTPNNKSVKVEMLPKQRPFSSGQVHNNLFFMFIGWAWDKLFLRSFVLNHELTFQEQRTTNDMYFTFAALVKAQKITLLNEELAIHRRNTGNSLSVTREQSWGNFYNALIAVRNEMRTMGVYVRYEQKFSNYALHSVLWNLNTLSDDIATKLFDKCLTDWFKNLGIYGHTAGYFSSKAEFAEYEKIMMFKPGEYAKYRSSK